MIEKTRKEILLEKKLLSKIGDKIKVLRLEKGLTQYELAIDSKVTENQIGRIERAEVNTSIVALFNIASALSIDIKELL